MSTEWTEVSVRDLDGELTEAVSEVLAEVTGAAPVIERHPLGRSFDPSLESEEESRFLVRVFFPSDAHGTRLAERCRQALWHLGRIQPIPEPSISSVTPPDPHAAPPSPRFQPGHRLLVLTPWDEDPIDPHLLPIRLEPGGAFGTGAHPSTQLCLRLLEEVPVAGQEVLDVGCGSGILSVGAARLSAHHVCACDLDSAAIQATREAAEANQVARQISVVHGSSDAFRGPFGVVVGNLITSIILKLLPTMARVGAADGHLILGGILKAQQAEVLTAVRAEGFSLQRQLTSGDWVALACNRSSDRAD